MKLRTRKFLAGLLSFGMLLQAASPLSALAAESGSTAPELTITLLRENEDTPHVGKIGQNTDSITLDGQSYQVDYQDGTYTLTGTMGTFHGSHIGDHLTISGPSDGVKPNLVVRKGENHEVANAYVKVENVNDFTSDSIVGITEFTCDGDINITADYYAVLFSFRVNSAHDVTVISEKTTGQFVVGSASINCTGKVTLRNEGQGALTHGSGITIRGAQDGVELYCKNATRIANGISIKNCKGDISIINENGPIGDPSVSNDLTVGGSGDTGVENVTIKANASGPVTNGKISITAKTLNMQNDSGSIGNLTFTRTDTTSDYYIVTGDSASSASQTKMEGTVYGPEAVSAKYLCISPNGYVPTPATPYGFSVNGTAITSENAETALPDGMTYDKAANKLTASKDITGALSIAADDTKTTLAVELKSVDGALTVGKYGVPGAQNVTINGDITGKIDINCTGNVSVNGMLSSNVSSLGGDIDISRIDTTNGSITVTSDGAVWGDGVRIVLKALSGPVKVSGNKPNEDLVGNSLTVWATETEISNPDGRINAIQFVPQEDGDYYINKDTEPAEQRDFAVKGEKVIYSKAVDSKLTISRTKYVAPAELAITVNGKTYTFGNNAAHAALDGMPGVVVTYFANGDHYTIDGKFNGDVIISGTNGKKPNVHMNSSNGQIVSRTLTVTDVNDFTASSTVEIAGEKLVITADGDVDLSGKFIETEVKAKSLTMQDDSSNPSLGKVTFTAPDGKTYVAATDEGESTNVPKGDTVKGSYLHIEEDKKSETKYTIYVNGKVYTRTDGSTFDDVKPGGGYVLISRLVLDPDIRYSDVLWEKDEGSAAYEIRDGFDEYSINIHLYPTEEGDVRLKLTGTEFSYRVIPDDACALADTEIEFYKAGETVTIKSADAEQVINGIKVTTKKDGATVSVTKLEDGAFTFTMPSSPVYVTADTSVPDPDPDTPDTPDTPASGDGSGALVATVAIGGTALFVGYEVVTDIILGNILPEGVDVPVNRGQLAWLIWGAEGAPLPENQPAFTDVSDPEMALAAQWCVEQGILDAKSETTFRPNGWTPKFMVIKAWNKAFPAAK